MPFLDTGRARLFYMCQGPADAPPIVFSNSLGTTHRMWDAVVGELAAEHNCIRYDTRGHGLSDVTPAGFEIADLADDLYALIDHLELPRAHVAGLSLGGMTGQSFAARYAARTASLTLMATTAFMPTRESWYQRAALVRHEGSQAIVQATLSRWFTDDFRGTASQEVELVAETLRSIPAEGYAACCEAIGRMDLRSSMRNIRAPTTVIAGRDDPATPVAMSETMHEAIPGSRLVVFAPAAHLLAVEQPGAVAREIEQTIRSQRRAYSASGGM